MATAPTDGFAFDEFQRMAVAMLTLWLEQDEASDEALDLMWTFTQDAQRYEHGAEGLSLALTRIAGAAIEELAALGALTNEAEKRQRLDQELAALGEPVEPRNIWEELPGRIDTPQGWLRDLALKLGEGEV